MKKYILLLAAACITTFTACDYNDRNFGDLDELATPPNIASYEYTITDADIATIVKLAKATGDAEYEKMADRLNADKAFSDAAPANLLVPFLLKDKYYSADVKSSANITYKYAEGRNEVVTELSTKAFVINDEGYKSVWGESFVAALTPLKSPESNIPNILKSQVEEPYLGMYRNVEYYYSAEEPEVSTIENRFLWEEFEGQTGNPSIAIDGWLNAKLEGNRTWDAKSFSGNMYAQMSSNSSKEINDVWLISKKTDLTNTTAPSLDFQVKVGYYNADCLSVLVSENFDGNEANIKLATWVDITSRFTIPQSPTSGYGEFVTSGTVSLEQYKGKNIYIAFRYLGDDTAAEKKTTTYQLDDVKIYEKVVGMDVKSKSLEYAAYRYDGSKWVKSGSSIVTLQPENYSEMGLTYLSSSQAPNYLPKWLKLNYIYAQDGDVKTVAYKTSASDYYADEYVYKGAEWEVNSFEITKTDQFVYSTSGWVFDPTYRETLQKGKEDTDGYMMLVNYVKANQALENPALVSSYGDSEYYYGFSGNYGNVSYREKDRSLDTSYPQSGTDAEKSAFMNQRTAEGVAVYLTLKYPDALPEVGGIEQLAEITVLVYSDPSRDVTNEVWTYTMKCIGNKEWQFIQRESQTGEVEKAAE